MRPKVILSALLLFSVCIVLSACATTPSGDTLWKEKATSGYETTGNILASVYVNSQKPCADGALSQDDCNKVKDVYIKARAAYITVGSTLILAIEAEDPIKRKDYLEAYQASASELSKLLPELMNLAFTLGIDLGGLVK